MSSPTARLRHTGSSPLFLLPRLLAGGPLLVFSLKHFADPGHFRDILVAAGVPMPDVNVMAASVAELAAGVLILTGFYARLGGLLGVATMLPAILTTVKFMGMSEHPFVPPLPLPVAVLLGSAAVVYWGAGPFSLDRAATAGAAGGGV